LAAMLTVQFEIANSSRLDCPGSHSILTVRKPKKKTVPMKPHPVKFKKANGTEFTFPKGEGFVNFILLNKLAL